MKNQMFSIILICFSLSQIVAQTESGLKSANRSTSIFLSIGSLQVLCIGTSFQLNEKYSVGVVSSFYGLAGSYITPRVTLGLGCRGAYYFSLDGKDKFLCANNISIDLEYLFPINPSKREKAIEKIGGIGAEIIVGRDSIVGKGFGFNWGCGLSMSAHGEAKLLLAPALKLGFHVDL